MNVEKVPEGQSCPYCNQEMKRGHNIGGEPMDMNNRPVLCKQCGEISMTFNKRLRKLTNIDIEAIKLAGFWDVISTDQRIIKLGIEMRKIAPQYKK